MQKQVKDLEETVNSTQQQYETELKKSEDAHKTKILELQHEYEEQVKTKAATWQEEANKIALENARLTQSLGDMQSANKEQARLFNFLLLIRTEFLNRELESADSTVEGICAGYSECFSHFAEPSNRF